MARYEKPPVEYLRQCSSTSLRYFEMSKLEHAANLRRELAVLLDEMMEETALALLARWMLERRSDRAASPPRTAGVDGRAQRRARDQLVGWLTSARQVESGAPLPAAGSAKSRTVAQGADPGSVGGAAPELQLPPGSREQKACDEAGPHSDRRTERKISRAARSSQRPSGSLRTAELPEGSG
jgi:hypothetical protein